MIISISYDYLKLLATFSWDLRKFGHFPEIFLRYSQEVLIIGPQISVGANDRSRPSSSRIVPFVTPVLCVCVCVCVCVCAAAGRGVRD